MNFDNCPTATRDQLRIELHDALNVRDAYHTALNSAITQNPAMIERAARALRSIEERIGLIRSAICNIDEHQANKNS